MTLFSHNNKSVVHFFLITISLIFKGIFRAWVAITDRCKITGCPHKPRPGVLSSYAEIGYTS